MEILSAGNKVGRLWPLALLLLAPMARTAGGQTADEYEVKAAFLYNFTKFVEWPQAGQPSSFTICILGDDPFSFRLDRLTEGKATAGRPIQTRRIKDGDDARQCQIVFVAGSEKSRASALVEATRGTAVLTVGESRDFARMGGVIFLTMEGDRVNVFINTTAAEQAGLKISAKLMTLAKIYKP